MAKVEKPTAEEIANMGELKINDNTPSEAQMRRGGKWAAAGIGLSVGLTAAYVAISAIQGELNPLDWIDTSDTNIDPEDADATKIVNATVTEDTVDAPAVEENTPTATKDACVPCQTPEPEPEPVVPVCKAEEAVVEETCLFDGAEAVATADSRCDGIISLTREALLQTAGSVTPDMVAGIEDSNLKAVYQALLDGDRSALTDALTKLYTENGAYIPENASGKLDGLKDSIIIFNGDKIVIDENGWSLARNNGSSIQIVNCGGDVRSLSDETKIDTGKCGDSAPAPVVEKGTPAPVIPVEELPVENLPEPKCVVEPAMVGRDQNGTYTGKILTINVYDDLDGNGVANTGDKVRVANVDARKYFDAHPEDVPNGVRKMRDGYYYNVERYEQYSARTRRY